LKNIPGYFRVYGRIAGNCGRRRLQKTKQVKGDEAKLTDEGVTQ
jgi:hypothetical protein